ncbi:MAG: hypothetical protein H6551_09080 [Chitinophagales bacterium]|nr:hypothetical protein [Chitinophagaceae bacterium]MCB9065274.1 hypothetical protein [Chitinophagales bacterium]
MKRNVSILGLLIGLLMPMLGIFIVYLIKFQGVSLGDFASALVRDFDQTAKILSLSILANIIPFIYYTNRRLDLTARGILIATMLYAVLIVLLKFVW